MKTQLLKLTPRDFCAATQACYGGTRFALRYKTMCSVWEHCPDPGWLCWILDKLDVPPDENTIRLYMVWCARNTPMHDGRTTGALLTEQASLDALVAAERFVRGEITAEALSAARSAAESAESAAESTAWSAARSAARSAAESAAESPAWSASESAARSVAESAESVAESAAWAAAWSAAESAESAAESAARAASESAARSPAWSAAWSAAESAARAAQADQLRSVVANPFA